MPLIPAPQPSPARCTRSKACGGGSSRGRPHGLLRRHFIPPAAVRALHAHRLHDAPVLEDVRVALHNLRHSGLASASLLAPSGPSLSRVPAPMSLGAMSLLSRLGRSLALLLPQSTCRIPVAALAGLLRASLSRSHRYSTSNTSL